MQGFFWLAEMERLVDDARISTLPNQRTNRQQSNKENSPLGCLGDGFLSFLMALGVYIMKPFIRCLISPFVWDYKGHYDQFIQFAVALLRPSLYFCYVFMLLNVKSLSRIVRSFAMFLPYFSENIQ